MRRVKIIVKKHLNCESMTEMQKNQWMKNDYLTNVIIEIVSAVSNQTLEIERKKNISSFYARKQSMRSRKSFNVDVI